MGLSKITTSSNSTPLALLSLALMVGGGLLWGISFAVLQPLNWLVQKAVVPALTFVTACFLSPFVAIGCYFSHDKKRAVLKQGSEVVSKGSYASCISTLTNQPEATAAQQDKKVSEKNVEKDDNRRDESSQSRVFEKGSPTFPAKTGNNEEENQHLTPATDRAMSLDI